METRDEFEARIRQRGVPVGSHLVVERQRKLGPLRLRTYTHHGIYLGNYMVSHYSGWATGMFVKGQICRVRIEEFADGGRLGIRKYKKRFRRDEVLQRVTEMEDSQPPYSVLRSNCEHYATYCVTGEHGSKQVSTLVWFGVVGQLVNENFFQPAIFTALSAAPVNCTPSRALLAPPSVTVAQATARSVVAAIHPI